jgi:hypothetical protein
MADFLTIADMRDRFPEFTVEVVPDATMQIYLDLADRYLSATGFGACRNEAALYYVAHRLTVAIRATKAAEASADGLPKPAGSGHVTTSTVRGLSISFATATPKNMTEAWYASTPYGEIYLTYTKSCLNRVCLAGSPG